MTDLMTLEKAAVNTLNGVGAGGNLHALSVCVQALEAGSTPARILDAARKGRNDKSLASHEGVVYGALIVHSGVSATPADAYKWAARIGRHAVQAILDGDSADKAKSLQAAWQTEVDIAAIKKAERDAAKRTADAFLVEGRNSIDSLLALRDQGVELTDEQVATAASLMEDLRVLVGIKVGANA